MLYHTAIIEYNYISYYYGSMLVLGNLEMTKSKFPVKSMSPILLLSNMMYIYIYITIYDYISNLSTSCI